MLILLADFMTFWLGCPTHVRIPPPLGFKGALDEFKRPLSL